MMLCTGGIICIPSVLQIFIVIINFGIWVYLLEINLQEIKLRDDNFITLFSQRLQFLSLYSTLGRYVAQMKLGIKLSTFNVSRGLN